MYNMDFCKMSSKMFTVQRSLMPSNVILIFYFFQLLFLTRFPSVCFKISCKNFTLRSLRKRRMKATEVPTFSETDLYFALVRAPEGVHMTGKPKHMLIILSCLPAAVHSLLCSPFQPRSRVGVAVYGGFLSQN